jgi:hypothetical protein
MSEEGRLPVWSRGREGWSRPGTRSNFSFRCGTLRLFLGLSTHTLTHTHTEGPNDVMVIMASVVLSWRLALAAPFVASLVHAPTHGKARE